MSLAEAIRDATNPVVKKCVVGKHIENMPPEDVEAVEFAFGILTSDEHHPVISATWLAKTMTDKGYKVGRTSLIDHAARRCCACHQ
jgi:hypothetical protein